jgi:hypothetical protein
MGALAAGAAVTGIVKFLDFGPRFGYTFRESRSRKGRQPVTPAGRARAVPAGGGSSLPLPGGSGDIRPAGTMTGLRGNSLDWDRKERVTPAEQRTIFRTIGIVRSDQVPGSA